MSQTKVVVESQTQDAFRQLVRAGEHSFAADEPADVGGMNAGPTPYELLLAALGACTSMTIQMYARRKGWQVEHVEVTLTHEKVHARDCDECETEGGFMDQVRRDIVVKGTLSDQERGRVERIANKCPVHKTLQSEVQIKTQLRVV